MKILVIGEPSERQQRAITALLKEHPDAEIVFESHKNFESRKNAFLEKRILWYNEYDVVLDKERFKDMWLQHPKNKL